MTAKRASIALLGGLLATFGCADTVPRTEVMVVIDAEPGVRAEAASLHVVVDSGPGRSAAPLANRLDRTFGDAGGPIGWPRSIAIVPLDGDATRIYRVNVTARNSAAAEVAVARAVSGFAPGQSLELRIVLEDACHAVSCGEEDTCRGGVCASAYRAPGTLPSFRAAADLDGGSGDGGLDAQDATRFADVGPVSDAGPDVWSLSCPGGSYPCDDRLFCTEPDMCLGGICTGWSGRNCDDGNPCTTDRCDEEADRCTHAIAADGSGCDGGACCSGACRSTCP